ncbi:unnamed protein product, partial [Brassica rapa]
CVFKALSGSESRWKVATLEMQMNLNQGKLKSENRNMIFQSLLLERVVRYLLLKPNLCGMNSNASKAEWMENHKCIIGEQQEEIQSTKKLGSKLTSSLCTDLIHAYSVRVLKLR